MFLWRAMEIVAGDCAWHKEGEYHTVNTARLRENLLWLDGHHLMVNLWCVFWSSKVYKINSSWSLNRHYSGTRRWLWRSRLLPQEFRSKNFPGDPVCHFRGKEIPSLVRWSESIYITSQIIFDVLKIGQTWSLSKSQQSFKSILISAGPSKPTPTTHFGIH